MRALLAQGADVDAMDLSNLTPLQNAAWGGSAACVHLLLAHGASTDVMPLDGGLHQFTTPLYIACLGGHEESVKALLAAGALSDLGGIRGSTTAPLLQLLRIGDTLPSQNCFCKAVTCM
jgi:ankyrin repeat protein